MPLFGKLGRASSLTGAFGLSTLLSSPGTDAPWQHALGSDYDSALVTKALPVR